MKIAKWGNSLAVRIPRDVVRALDLEEGDEVELSRRDERTLEIHKLTRAEALRRLRNYRGMLPAGYRFNRDEANAR
jgi:antitoxin MazE